MKILFRYDFVRSALDSSLDSKEWLKETPLLRRMDWIGFEKRHEKIGPRNIEFEKSLYLFGYRKSENPLNFLRGFFLRYQKKKKEMPFLKKNLTFRDPSFISFFRRIQISVASLSPYFSLVNVKKCRRIDRIERMRAMKIERIYLLFIGGNKRR